MKTYALRTVFEATNLVFSTTARLADGRTRRISLQSENCPTRRTRQSELRRMETKSERKLPRACVSRPAVAGRNRSRI